jgi:hypothetical protein
VARFRAGTSCSLKRVYLRDAVSQVGFKAGDGGFDVVDCVGGKQKDAVNTRASEFRDPVGGPGVTQIAEIRELSPSKGGIAEGIGYVQGIKTARGKCNVESRDGLG